MENTVALESTHTHLHSFKTIPKSEESHRDLDLQSATDLTTENVAHMNEDKNLKNQHPSKIESIVNHILSSKTFHFFVTHSRPAIIRFQLLYQIKLSMQSS